jgi:hypothetical protein
MTEPTNLAPPGDEDVEDLDELSEVPPTSFSITSYGADYPVDGLVGRIQTGDIVVPLFSIARNKDRPQRQ